MYDSLSENESNLYFLLKVIHEAARKHNSIKKKPYSV